MQETDAYQNLDSRWKSTLWYYQSKLSHDLANRTSNLQLPPSAPSPTDSSLHAALAHSSITSSVHFVIVIIIAFQFRIHCPLILCAFLMYVSFSPHLFHNIYIWHCLNVAKPKKKNGRLGNQIKQTLSIYIAFKRCRKICLLYLFLPFIILAFIQYFYLTRTSRL
jgi:hypothetical protein